MRQVAGAVGGAAYEKVAGKFANRFSNVGYNDALAALGGVGAAFLGGLALFGAGKMIARLPKFAAKIGEVVRSLRIPAQLRGIAPNIHNGQQGKHIKGHNDYIPGRSVLDGNIETAQALLSGALANKFKIIETRNGQPIVDFGRQIGVDNRSGLATQFGAIHTGNTGTHIVPVLFRGQGE